MDFFFNNKKHSFLPNLWQSKKWEKFQNLAGNKTEIITHNNSKALIIYRCSHWLKFWKPCIWEVPRGPIGDIEDFEILFKKIFTQAKEQNIPIVRIYPPLGDENFWERFPHIFKKNSYRIAPEIFPCHTLLLDINTSKDELLSQMKPKGRYNIKLAKKKGVKVFRETNIENFWNILQQTSKRDGFTANKKQVYQSMIDSFGDDVILLSAKDKIGEILASKIFLVSGEYGVYYYGASSNRKRNLMAPYLLQWEGILWTRSKGAKIYDFLGICPNGEKNHQLSSVAQFKHKFGGKRNICDTGIDFITS